MFDVNKEYEFFNKYLDEWFSAEFIRCLKNGNSDRSVFVIKISDKNETVEILTLDGRVIDEDAWVQDGPIVIREKRRRILVGQLGQTCDKEVAGWSCYEKVDT